MGKGDSNNGQSQTEVAGGFEKWGRASVSGTGIPGVAAGAGRPGVSLSAVQPCWLSQGSTLNVRVSPWASA